MVATVATNYSAYRSPIRRSDGVDSRPVKSSRSGKNGKWSIRSAFSSLAAKGKEMLTQKVVPFSGQLIKGVTVKALKAAQIAIEGAKHALTDRHVGIRTRSMGDIPRVSSLEHANGVGTPKAARKDLVAEGKRLLSAIEGLKLREKAIKEETARNTKMNAKNLHAPESVEIQHDASDKLSLCHPDDIKPKQWSSPHKSISQGPVGEEKGGEERVVVHSSSYMPPTSNEGHQSSAIQRKSLLFGASDLQQVKLKSLLKIQDNEKEGSGTPQVDLQRSHAASSSSSSKKGRRVSFGTNDTKMISPRAPKEVSHAQLPHQPKPQQAQAPPTATGFSINDLLGARNNLRVPSSMPMSNIHSSSSGNSNNNDPNVAKGVTLSGLKRVKLRPPAELKGVSAPRALPLSIEELLRQTLETKFKRANAVEQQSESSCMDEDDEEWL